MSLSMPSATRFSLTTGVLPTALVMSWRGPRIMDRALSDGAAQRQGEGRGAGAGRACGAAAPASALASSAGFAFLAGLPHASALAIPTGDRLPLTGCLAGAASPPFPAAPGGFGVVSPFTSLTPADSAFALPA